MLVLTADIAGRMIVPPGELEVGIVTAFIGAPVLMVLVLRLSSGAKGRKRSILGVKATQHEQAEAAPQTAGGSR